MVSRALQPWLGAGFVVWTNLAYLGPAYVAFRRRLWFRVFMFLVITGVSSWYHVESDVNTEQKPGETSDTLDHITSVYLTAGLPLLLIDVGDRFNTMLEVAVLLGSTSLVLPIGTNPPAWSYGMPPLLVLLLCLALGWRHRTQPASSWMWLLGAVVCGGAAFALYSFTTEWPAHRKWLHGGWHVLGALAMCCWMTFLRAPVEKKWFASAV
jgi:hypothetical protein